VEGQKIVYLWHSLFWRIVTYIFHRSSRFKAFLVELCVFFQGKTISPFNAFWFWGRLVKIYRLPLPFPYLYWFGIHVG